MVRFARSNRGLIFIGLLLVATLFLGNAAPVQDRTDRTAQTTAPGIRQASPGPDSPDARVSDLRQARLAGDTVKAARLFALLFPPDLLKSPTAVLKTSTATESDGMATIQDAAKILHGTPVDRPVITTGENEKSPSIDRRATSDGSLEIFVAAERWLGNSPRAIEIKRSDDRGTTWPLTAVIGDRYPRGRPSIRQISSDAMGVIYTRDWSDTDSDIYYARLSSDLSSVTEVPVECNLDAQSHPSLASDYPSAADPYIYAVYSERSGNVNRVKFRVSQDLGATWSLPVTVAEFTAPRPVGGFTSLAVDPQTSELYVAFDAWQGDSEGIAVSRSRTFGYRWTPAEFVTAPDDLPDLRPRIVAAGGTVVVAWERTVSDTNHDILFASKSASGADWTTGVLADSPENERFPDVRAGQDPAEARIFASFVKGDSRVVVRTCLAKDASTWTEEKDVKGDTNLVDDDAVALLPLAGLGGSTSAGAAWSERNPDYDVFYNARVIITAAGPMSVTPPDALTSSGTVGGPFTPSSVAYNVQNTGDTAMDWTATNTMAWVTVSPSSGTLAAGATTTVTVSINSAANSLAVGVHTDTVTFTNVTTGTGNTTRGVSLTVNPAPGVLSVTPATGLTSTGFVGGPFTPSSVVYTLQNTGGTSLNWTALKTQPWLTLSATSGALAAGATTTVTVTINSAANSLTVGNYLDSVTFTNTTNGSGNTTRVVDLTISNSPGALTMTPAGGLTSTGYFGGPFSPSSITYTLTNVGGSPITFTAATVQPWVSLSSTGQTLLAGANCTVTVSINATANTLAAGTYTDTLTIINTTNGSGNTTRPISLTVSATPGTLVVTPATGLTSTGTAGGPFAPSSAAYTLQNGGQVSLNWTATKTQAWVTISAASGTLAAGATTTVTVSINATANTLTAGTYADTVTFTNATNGSGNTTRAVSLTVSAPGALTVTPTTGLTSSGLVGGPFSPASQAYTLQNTGGVSINWTAAKVQAWVDLSAAGGTLAAGATTTVTVSINATANTLAAGTYADTVTFTNTTNGSGNTTRAVSLTVTAPGALTVTPATGLDSTGVVGGPFAPSSITFTLQNTGGVSINWSTYKNKTWTTLSTAGGTLAPGATTTLVASINASANTMSSGNYNDIVTITNDTNGNGNTTRPINLTISTPGAMTVTPATGLTSTGNVGGPFSPASAAYTLTNTGGVSVNWTATKTQTWVTLSAASGTLASGATATVTVTINATANSLAAGTYSDTVTFTNTTNGAGNTTRAVSLTIATPGTMTVTPASGLVSSGAVGGPFTPASAAYTLTNTGGLPVNWTATKVQTWTTLSAASGTLNAGATATVTVSINTIADSLAAGSYTDTVTFTNTTNGTGNTTRAVSLTVSIPGALTVTPATGLDSSGIVGGPFTPSSITYTVQNTGGVPIDWLVFKNKTWMTLSTSGGTLAAGASTTVVATVNASANTLSSGNYTDTITFENSTNGSGNTSRPVTLTVNPTPGMLSVTPVGGLVSTGPIGGPFSPSSQAFSLRNTGDLPLNWTAGATQSWVTLSLLSGTLASGATATVTVSINTNANLLAIGSYADTVTFTNTTNGGGNTTRPVNLTVTQLPGALSVTPTTAFTSSGHFGGPFTPVSATYTLQNTGGIPLNWTAAKTQAWLTLSATSGTLASGATTTVTASINANANTLAQNTYGDIITFTNTTNGSGNTTRSVTLTVTPPAGVLNVTPSGGLNSFGEEGGPFEPPYITYTLQNTGLSPLTYTVTRTQSWVSLSASSGTLAVGASATVTVTIGSGASSLAAGSYSDTVSFTNTTDGSGNTTRAVNLTVSPPPTLSVAPDNRDVTFAAAQTTFSVANLTGGTMNWTATVISGGTWLTITSGVAGTNSGTITAAFTQNQGTLPRQGIIRVTASGAAGSPKDVTVTQGVGSFTVQLSGQRLTEKAWIVQREYARLTLTINNPASIPVGSYVVYRQTGVAGYQLLQQVPGSSVLNSPWVFNDTFIDSGVTYKYKIQALDSTGALIGESNEITI